MRLSLWTLASIAAVASAAALYFALRSHHEHLRTAGFATQLSMKEQELSENQSELERSKSALARLAMAAKQTTRPANAPTVAPAPSSSPDLHGLPPAIAELKRQNSLAMLRSIYDALLTQLNLSPEQRKRFYELRLAAEDSQGLSPDSEEELRKMFGERGFQFYQSYADTERERRCCRSFGSRSTQNRYRCRIGSMTACWTPWFRQGDNIPGVLTVRRIRMEPLWAKPRSFSRPTN